MALDLFAIIKYLQKLITISISINNNHCVVFCTINVFW